MDHRVGPVLLPRKPQRVGGIPGWPRVTREIAVDPADDSVAYLAVSQFGVDQVLRTSDRGDNWEPITGNLPDVPANTVAVYRDGESRAIFLGTDAGVFMASGDETVWSLYGAGIPHSPVNDMVVDTQHGRLVASTMGRGMWTIELPLLGGGEPIPAMSVWGIGMMLLLIVIAGMLVFTRKAPAPPSA